MPSGRGYETFGNGTAETLMQIAAPDETSAASGTAVCRRRASRFRWSARDNVNYNETAALAALDYAAQQSHTLLRNFYHAGLAHSWRKGVERAALRVPHPGRSGRSHARRAAGRAAAWRSTSRSARRRAA